MSKKKLLIKTFLIGMSFLFAPKNTYAITSSDYVSRNVCNSKYELAEATEQETIIHISCHDTYQDAKNNMTSNKSDNLIILDSTNGNTRIADAKYALLDLSVNPETLTYFYESKDLNTRIYTYMDTGSLYGGVDGALLDVNYNKSVKVKIGGLSAWIKDGTYEIVPLVWVKSSSSYTVTDSIRHNYVAKIQNTYTGSAGSTIGPKPTQLQQGTYYSYDGHYFYKDRLTMLKDYKNGNYNNSINKDNPYYNYYMFLSNHSKTTYSSRNIDEYIRNNMGITQGLYGDQSKNKSSRLYGQGTYFYYAQQRYGANALLSLSLNRNESANGRSNIAIKKNNGFGLNAVDSNPYQDANWFPTYASSILEFASKWITDGYADPSDSRYFGPAFGDKYIGMNVKYASDTYWSEKMAANYYSFDKAKGLQDYNYYQLGVVNSPTSAYLSPTAMSTVVYTYPEKDDSVLIVGEVTNAEGTWYKLQSDKIINGSIFTTVGDYNWDSYVYVKKEQVTKINTAKDGYKYPNDVTEYNDSNYTYDLYVKDATLTPKVAITTNNVDYYYDSTLEQKTGKTLLKDKWIMVYSAAYDKDGKVVSYLVTSDYKYDQKEWIPAGNIKFQTTGYGKVQVDITGAYTWVNSTPTDTSETLISGLYTYTYVPLITSTTNEGYLWYKVPVNLTGNTNSYGWTIAECTNVKVNFYMYNADEDNKILEETANTAPTINASDKTITQGTTFNKLEGVTATDKEDGTITNKITVTGEVNTNTPGTYKLTYSVTDSKNLETKKVITITVVKNESPVINVSDQTITINSSFNPLNNVSATDKEDGDITKKITVTENTVNTKKTGEYKVVYKVKDSYGNEVTKKIKVNVIEKSLEKTEGIFYLHYLKESNDKLKMQGYQTIIGINNDLNNKIEYEIIFKNIDTENEITLEANRIKVEKDIPKKVYSPDGKDYTYSWFNITIDINNLPIGNYKMYAVAKSTDKYSKSLISNKSYNQQATKVQTSNYSAIINNNYDTSTSYIEIKVRDNLLANKTSSYIYNQYEKYTKFEFNNNNTLHLRGNSYSYGMNLSKNSNVERTIIFENTSTYKTYTKKLTSISSGNYNVVLPVSDNLSKEKAWYDSNIDLSDIPKGTYLIYISTKANITDISEMKEKLSRNLDDVKKVINNKNYSFRINKTRGNRIEMIVE